MKENKKVRKAGKSAALVCALVIGILFVYATFPHPVLVVDEDTGSWNVVWEYSIASADENATISVQGVNLSGILSVYFHPHVAVNMTSYFENSSLNLENNCTGAGLGWSGEDDNESDLQHSIAFDVVFRVQGNNSNCKVGGIFYDTNLKIQWTCAGLSVAADTELTVGAGEGRWTANDTTYTYLYMNFWDDNGGCGFTISQDQTIEITSIKFEAYF